MGADYFTGVYSILESCRKKEKLKVKLNKGELKLLNYYSAPENLRNRRLLRLIGI